MTAPESETRLRGKLKEHGQEHVLEWLEELEDPERERLLEQLRGLDFGRLADFRELLESPPEEVSFDDVEPAPVERLPRNEKEREAEKSVRRMGRRAFEQDRVAAMTVAGGQGTRLGYDHPKGMYPISPIRKKSLFRLFAEQIMAARRRYGCSMPWLIMTGHTNDEETREFFEEKDYFGLGEDSVHFFVQHTNPILSAEGRLLRAERDELLIGPDGHGGVFKALADGGMLDLLREGGYQFLSHFQVDNPLVTVADERYLGYHIAHEADFSCKVVPKRDPGEGLGIAVLKGRGPAVIEYIDVPEEIAAQKTDSGELRYLFGSIAIHIIDVAFVDRMIERGNKLPWHVAEKTYDIYEGGGKVSSPENGCRKFERFVFDSLRFADECAFVEVDREDEFGPVKNAEGEDSPATARRLLQQQWLNWLEEAGFEFDRPRDLSEGVIEISPLYATGPEDLRERLEPVWTPSFPLALEL